jgi:hypothetical protein
VIAMPMEAKEREVRSQARKVRSVHQNPISTRPNRRYLYTFDSREESRYVPKAKWSRATLPLFSNSTLPHFSQKLLHHPASLPSVDEALSSKLSLRCWGVLLSTAPAAVPSCVAGPEKLKHNPPFPGPQTRWAWIQTRSCCASADLRWTHSP